MKKLFIVIAPLLLLGCFFSKDIVSAEESVCEKLESGAYEKEFGQAKGPAMKEIMKDCCVHKKDCNKCVINYCKEGSNNT